LSCRCYYLLQEQLLKSALTSMRPGLNVEATWGCNGRAGLSLWCYL
jgi:hypothetical protein